MNLFKKPNINRPLGNFFLIVFIMGFCGLLYSEERFEPKYLMRPLFGCFITDLYDFDYQSNKFDVSGYMWTRHKEAEYKPHNSIEIINSKAFQGRTPYVYSQDGLTYSGQRFNATIFHHWDMTKFPFDKQVLKIHFQDSWYDAAELEFLADTKDSDKSSGMYIPGW